MIALQRVLFIKYFFAINLSAKEKQDTQDRKRQDEQDGLIYPANHAGSSPIIFILFFLSSTESPCLPPQW
jgi:hypothetical protein